MTAAASKAYVAEPANDDRQDEVDRRASGLVFLERERTV